MPLFVWAIYATSIIQVLATPVLGLTLLLVGDRAASFGFGIFDPARGGDPVLFQHLFWFYSHPAVYIMVLPAMGVISEVIARVRAARTSSATRRSRTRRWASRFVGFFTWGHHMFVVGPVDVRRRRLRRALDAGRRLHRHQGLQLGGHAVQGRDRVHDAVRSTSAASSSSSCSAA